MSGSSFHPLNACFNYLIILSRLSLILGILYLTFQAFPIIFAGKHGFNPGQTNLSFMGVLVGELIALTSMVYWAPYVSLTLFL